MEKAKKRFAEFKSIFFTKDILKENESHANIVVATTMLNLFLVCFITYLLVSFNIFKVGSSVMNTVLAANIFLLAIPSIICFAIKGNSKRFKVFLFTCFILAMSIADTLLKYNVTLLIVLPVILAARYYNKKFTIWVIILTFIAFLISPCLSIYSGQQDLNTYNLVIPQGTSITVETTLRDALSKIDVNETERVKNIYIHFFLPKLFVYSIISFACLQISQSGKKMIEKQTEITAKTSRLNTELNLAYNIQKSMLQSNFPAFPGHDEIDIYATTIPAKEVGGDFYDMFLIDDNHLAISIADVSGKGVPAALLMMVSKILIKVITDEGNNVNEVISRVNNILSDGNQMGLFITAWFGILDLKTGVIEYVNAGHNAPFVYSNKNKSFGLLKTKANFVIGGMENIKYEKEKYQLEPEDRLFLYTDGVVEATNKDNKMYGEERLHQFLENSLCLDAKETVTNLKMDLDKFAQKTVQFDDITMLELVYHGLNISRKEFKAELNELPNVQNFVNRQLSYYKVDKKIVNEINLATEEIFVNIVNYAYKEKEGNCIITINNMGNCVEYTFEDNGIPFNPLENVKPDITLSKEDREIGGLGIYLVEQIMDNVDYKYQNNKNILTIKKNIK